MFVDKHRQCSPQIPDGPLVAQPCSAPVISPPSSPPPLNASSSYLKTVCRSACLAIYNAAGLPLTAKLTIRKSYGFRSPEILEMALYHALGKLPEPELTHEFY